EGGMRVPCVVRWPERIPAESVCHELTTMMDWLPTFAHLAGASAPRDRKLDGHDITPLLMGESDAKSPYEAFYYYHTDQLQAVRDHRWKLAVAGGDATAESPYLFDLSEDLAEAKNVAEAHPEVVSRLSAHLERAREDLGDQDRKGEHVRPVGRADWE
ncbi:MAG: sulfatase-like hydrolase/transferase, partial [Planctomycetales bacterium]|nr:sulfatase-like hydrolase/transferase [Planctomycetales bacterium]